MFFDEHCIIKKNISGKVYSPEISSAKTTTLYYTQNEYYTINNYCCIEYDAIPRRLCSYSSKHKSWRIVNRIISGTHKTVSAKDNAVLTGNSKHSTRCKTISAGSSAVSGRDKAVPARLNAISTSNSDITDGSRAISAGNSAAAGGTITVSAENSTMLGRNSAIAGRNSAVSAGNSAISIQNSGIWNKNIIYQPSMPPPCSNVIRLVNFTKFLICHFYEVLFLRILRV